MKKQTDKTNKAEPKQDGVWFKRRVSELGTDLEKLAGDRQEQLEKDMEAEKEK